ncbi:hypothetical protein Tco_0480312 [Tanacetum coccineum]
MSITKEQQQALDDALVPREQHLQIGSCNYRLSTTFKPKEPTFQVALDVLSLTPFLSSLLDHCKNMLQICPKLSGKQFVDPPFEEEILTFMRELGYSGNIKLLSDVKVEMLPQPWRTFGTIINKLKSLSGKGRTYFSNRKQGVKAKKYMYYPRFTKVIINHFMSQDQSIPRRNKVDWHMANDDPILTTMRFIPQHEVIQKYGAIFPDNLTNQAMKESKAYMTYFSFATGKAIPKPKYVRRSTKEKTEQAPKTSSSKRLKATAKVTKLGKKKQHTKGLETLSEVALTEAEQMKISLKRSKTQQHSSHASGSGADAGTGVTSGVLDFSTHYEEDKEEDSFDPRVQTPSHVESTDNEDSDEEIQGANVELETLDNDFSEFKQTNQFATAISLIPGIVDTYLANKMSEAVKTAVQLQSDRLKDEAQAENEDFINKVDDNIKKIIKDQVKEQVKAQVSKILLKIKKTVNEQLKAEVLTRSSNKSKTSHAIAANLSELELKKILIDNMKSNKSIHRSDEQKNLYKAFDKNEESSAGSNRGSKRRRAGKEPESTSAPKEKTSKTTGKSTEGSKSHHNTLAQKEDTHKSFIELMDTPLDFSSFMMNRLKVDTLTPELLADPTFELMKGSCKSLVELEYFLEEVYKETTDKLEWINPEECGVKFREFSRDVYSKRRIIVVTLLQIVKWHNYKHLDWITVRRDDDKLYKLKDGDFKRLRIQDIEDMLLFLIQGKSIAIQRHVEDLQLGIESYQKKFNHTKPDTYRSDLKQREAYTAYSNPRGFIYQNKDKKNRLMRIDELYKFSDGTLNDVRTALDDRLKGIRMQYLPHTIWRESDRDKVGAMI